MELRVINVRIERDLNMMRHIPMAHLASHNIRVRSKLGVCLRADRDIVRHTRIMISNPSREPPISPRIQKQPPTHIIIGRGLSSATSVYHSTTFSCVTTVPKYPGASTNPHCAPAASASASCSSTSSTEFVKMPAMIGYSGNPASPSPLRTPAMRPLRSALDRWIASPVEPRSTRPRMPDLARKTLCDTCVDTSTGACRLEEGE
jgi:hypothetical protein